MNAKILGWIMAALILGGVIGYSINRIQDPDLLHRSPVYREPIVVPDEVPKLSTQDAVTHRETHYENITDLKEIQALPSDFAQTEALYSVAGRSNVDELIVLLDEADRIANHHDRRGALQILFSRYAELDPEGALEHLDSMRLPEETMIVGVIFYQWARMEVNAAIDAANNETHPQRQRIAASSIMRAWGGDNPGIANEIASRLNGHINIDELRVEALAAQARTTPANALNEALNLTNVQARNRAINWILYTWAQLNPREAYEHARSISNRQLRQMAQHTVLNRWSEVDPEEAFAYLGDSLSPQEQLRLLPTIMTGLAARDPARALEIADNLDGRAGDQAYQSVFQGWAQRDARAAAAALESIPPSRLRDQLTQNVAHFYASQHPQEALAWARNSNSANRADLVGSVLRQVAATEPEQALSSAMVIQNPTERARALSSVLSQVAGTQPELAATYVQQLPPGQFRDQASQNVVSTWSQHDPEAAFEWVSGLDGQAYHSAMTTLGSQLASQNPDAAARLLPRIRSSAKRDWISSIASAYAQNDPRYAANWISQFKSETYYNQLVSNVATSWVRTDPLAAIALAEEVAGPQRRPGAINSVVYAWAQNDPEGAARWAGAQQDEQIRTNSISAVAQRWARIDFDSASRWVTSLDPGTDRDMAISNMINHENLSTERKMSMIALINTEQTRNQAISNVFYRMVQQDRNQARVFLQNYHLDPALRQKLQNHMDAQDRGH